MGRATAGDNLKRRTLGFTFVEIMIVVLILAISAALAVPRIGDAAPTKLISAARLVVADLTFAQVESISHSDNLRVVVFDTTLNQYHIAGASDTTVPITHPTTRQAYTVKFGSGSSGSLSGVTFGGLGVGDDKQLKFGPYGQIDQTAAATITLVCQGKTLVIIVDPTTGEAAIGSVN
ncbi:MAG: prepilin-type N-terminal cleavage/methylation domain-containing protein [Phycisphaeraceae bacterium]